MRHSAGIAAASRYAASGILEAEAHLESHLEVADLARLNEARDLGHLEQVDVPDGLGRSLDPVPDGRVNAIGGSGRRSR
jgi:hypothetical protein